MAKISKSLIAEQALRRLAKGDVPSDFHIKLREVILLVPQIRDYLVEKSYFANLNADGTRDIDTRYLTVFDNVPIEYDEAKDLKYSILPADYIDLPDNLGLYHVSPMKGQNKKFKIVTPSFLSMFDGLEASMLHGHVGIWVEGDRIYYTNKFEDEPYQCETVLMKLVASIDDTEDGAEIFMPKAIQLQVIDTIVQFFEGGLQQLKDRVNDNLPQP